MGRLPFSVAIGLGLFAGMFSPAAAWAAPPPLPEGDVGEGAEPAPAEPAPAGDAAAPADPAPAAEPPADAGTGASADVSATGEVELPGDRPGADADADADVEGEGRRGRRGGADEAADTDDPGMVRGRREPLMPMNRGAIGLFHTTLPDVGGKYTFRFRLHTDFFRKDAFIYNGPPSPDQHARVRGGVTMGFTPFKWGELFFSVNSQANRNQRDQAGRQDAETMFALGDIDFGVKGAHRFKNGIGVGGQLGLGLLSGSRRLFTDGVNFWFDGLFAVDVRYLTKKHFPFRFTTNIGWMLDNSLTVAPFGSITDDVSREVTRFSLGANHNRVRMRYAIDFPVRLGKERQFGIDPILEWSWDVSTQEETPAFGRDDAEASPLPRGSQWLTLGVRGNVVSGLHVDAAVDIGLVSPNYEFGPPVPPWQVILGLGWSFDPNPTIKEVEVEGDTPPPPPQKIAEGRIVGQVTDPQGTPIPDARISFPGLTSTAIVTDANGSFTSFRFPAGTVTLQVAVNGQVLKETTADVKDGEDTPLTIQLDQSPTPATGVVQGGVTDPTGKGVAGTIRVVGQGVDQAFDINADGLFALELYEGDYTGTINAPGFKPKTVSFTVQPGKEISVSAQLEADAPVDTPNVSATSKAIRLKKPIRYDGDAVAASSHAILDELAAFLNGHPEILLVQVGVHTDDRGAAQKRSQSRAESVVSYLVGKGVSASRLSAKGYGASKPVAVNMTAAGRAKNNRTGLSIKQKQ